MEPWPLRIFRSLAWIGLAIALIPLISLACMAIGPDWSRLALQGVSVEEGLREMNLDRRMEFGVGMFYLFAVLLFPVVLLLGAWWLRLRSWAWILTGYAVVAVAYMHLLGDEPLRYSPTLEAMAPALPGDERSHAVLMRYSRKHPSPEALAFLALDERWKGSPMGLGTDFYLDNRLVWNRKLVLSRAEIEAAWAALAPQRRWLAELNSYERLGDLTEPDFRKYDHVNYNVWRQLAYGTAAMASLQALDGNGDAAIAMLLPLLEVSQKLPVHSRNKIRSLIAVVSEKVMLKTAFFVLDHAAVSPAMRARLAAALARAPDRAIAIRHIAEIDFVFAAAASKDLRMGDLFALLTDHRYPPLVFLLNRLSPLFYHPHRTINQCGDLVTETQARWSRRKIPETEALHLAFYQEASGPHIRNFLGNALVAYWMPSYRRIPEPYWDGIDLRDKLQARLAGG